MRDISKLTCQKRTLVRQSPKAFKLFDERSNLYTPNFSPIRPLKRKYQKMLSIVIAVASTFFKLLVGRLKHTKKILKRRINHNHKTFLTDCVISSPYVQVQVCFQPKYRITSAASIASESIQIPLESYCARLCKLTFPRQSKPACSMFRNDQNYCGNSKQS